MPLLQPAMPPETTKPAVAFRHGLLLLLCLSIVTAARWLEIRDERQVCLPGWSVSLPELCHSRIWLGVPCPGCGLTRGMIAMAHGRVAEAWNHNPGSLFLWGLILFQIPLQGWKLWRCKLGRRRLEPGRIMGSIWIAMMAVLLAQWCWRWKG